MHVFRTGKVRGASCTGVRLGPWEGGNLLVGTGFDNWAADPYFPVGLLVPMGFPYSEADGLYGSVYLFNSSMVGGASTGTLPANPLPAKCTVASYRFATFPEAF